MLLPFVPRVTPSPQHVERSRLAGAIRRTEAADRRRDAVLRDIDRGAQAPRRKAHASPLVARWRASLPSCRRGLQCDRQESVQSPSRRRCRDSSVSPGPGGRARVKPTDAMARRSGRTNCDRAQKPNTGQHVARSRRYPGGVADVCASASSPNLNARTGRRYRGPRSTRRRRDRRRALNPGARRALGLASRC